ncbi:hypothetical protein JA1_005445, partial [Spathaspora sp. JA1]
VWYTTTNDLQFTKYTTTYTDDLDNTKTGEVIVSTNPGGVWYTSTKDLDFTKYTSTYTDDLDNAKTGEVIVSTNPGGVLYTSTKDLDFTKYTTAYTDGAGNNKTGEVLVTTDTDGNWYTATSDFHQTNVPVTNTGAGGNTYAGSTGNINTGAGGNTYAGSTGYTNTGAVPVSKEPGGNTYSASQNVVFTKYTTTYLNSNKPNTGGVMVTTDAEGNWYTTTSAFVHTRYTTTYLNSNNPKTGEVVVTTDERGIWYTTTVELSVTATSLSGEKPMNAESVATAKPDVPKSNGPSKLLKSSSKFENDQDKTASVEVPVSFSNSASYYVSNDDVVGSCTCCTGQKNHGANTKASADVMSSHNEAVSFESKGDMLFSSYRTIYNWMDGNMVDSPNVESSRYNTVAGYSEGDGELENFPSGSSFTVVKLPLLVLAVLTSIFVGL